MATTTQLPGSSAPALRGAPSGRAGFGGALRSEFTKIRSVRSTYWTLIALVVVTIGIGTLACVGAVSRGADHGPDVDAAREPAAHGDETIVVAQQARGVGQQYARLGEAAREHESLHDVEKAVLVVQVRLEIGRVDRHEALGAGRHGFHGGAHFLERTDHADLVLIRVRNAGHRSPRRRIALREIIEIEFPGRHRP